MVEGPYLAFSNDDYSGGHEYTDDHRRDQHPLNQYGVTRTLVEVFSVGNRHFPKLAEAIAKSRQLQAKCQVGARRSSQRGRGRSDWLKRFTAPFRLAVRGAVRAGRRLRIALNWTAAAFSCRRLPA